MLRHKLGQFAHWKPPHYWRSTHLSKEFSFGHCLRNAEESILILSLSAPSDVRWGIDLYSADKLSVPGHYLTHRTWTSWICSALELSMTAFSQDFTEYGPPLFEPTSVSDSAWAALPWMIYNSPSFRESLDGPIHKHFADFQLCRDNKYFRIQFIHRMKSYHFSMVFIITPLHNCNFK